MKRYRFFNNTALNNTLNCNKDQYLTARGSLEGTFTQLPNQIVSKILQCIDES